MSQEPNETKKYAVGEIVFCIVVGLFWFAYALLTFIGFQEGYARGMSVQVPRILSIVYDTLGFEIASIAQMVISALLFGNGFRMIMKNRKLK